MSKISTKDKDLCPIDFSMKLLGGKWKILVLWYLKDEVLRFGQLKERIPGNITQKMLSKLLGELEEDSLVRRKVYAEVPPRVEYSLTEFGNSLIPFLLELRDWGQLALEKTQGGMLKQLKYTKANQERLKNKNTAKKEGSEQPEPIVENIDEALFTPEKRTYFNSDNS